MTRQVIEMFPPRKKTASLQMLRAPAKRSEPRLMKMLFRVAAVLFMSEFAVMCIVPLLGLNGMWEAFVDSLLLAILALPVLYMLGLRSHARIEARHMGQYSRVERQVLFIVGANVVLVAALVTVYGLLATEHEAGSRVINVAGRQRMLSQRLVQAGMVEAMEFAHAELAGLEPRKPDVIRTCSAEFERALRGLIEGDPGLGLPRCSSDEAVRQLKAVGEAWKPLRALLKRTSEPLDMDGAFAYYAALADAGNRVLSEMETAVSALETHYKARANLLGSMLGLIIVAEVVVSLMLTVTLHQVMRHRKRIEAALRESEAKIRAIVDNAADGIITIDERGTIESFNGAAEHLFGYAAEEAIGKNVSMLVPAPHREVHGGYIRRYLETGEKKVIGMAREVPAQRKDGSTFPIELHVSEVRLRDRWLFTGIARDITERKNAQEQMEILARLPDENNDPVLRVAKEGTILYANDASAPLLSLWRTSVGDPLPENLRQAVSNVIQRALPREIEVTCEERAFALTLAPIVRAGYVNVYGRDITECKQWEQTLKDHTAAVEAANVALEQAGREAEEARERAETAKQDLQRMHEELVQASRRAGMAEVATDILHNVGNVLTGVNASAAVVADTVRHSRSLGLLRAAKLMQEHADELGAFITGDPKGRHLPAYLIQLAQHVAAERATILEELKSLDRDIEHINNIIAVQQGHAEAPDVVEPVAVAGVLDDVLRISVASVSRFGIEIVREYDDIPPVALSRHKLVQILVNLVTNAKHALVSAKIEGKTLWLRLRKCGEDRVCVQVADNGVGIPKENLTAIFSHGFTTKEDGHGFGLHSAALAARDMGGSLTASSDGWGKGATFTLELPLQQPRIKS